MSTDSQGRPLSDDGQWAWNGTEWVPAAGGATTPAADEGDSRQTMIAQSPLAGGPPAFGPGSGDTPSGAPTPGHGGAPAAAQAPGYGGAAPGYGSTPGAGAPGGPGGPGDFGAAPGYVGGGAGYGAPPQQKSRTPLIAGIIGVVVVIVAVVLVLVFALGGDSKSSSLSGAFKCSVPGSSDTGTITFNSGGKYSLSDNGKSGNFTKDGDKVTFSGGSLDKAAGTYDSGAKTVKITFSGATLTCKK